MLNQQVSRIPACCREERAQVLSDYVRARIHTGEPAASLTPKDTKDKRPQRMTDASQTKRRPARTTWFFEVAVAQLAVVGHSAAGLGFDNERTLGTIAGYKGKLMVGLAGLYSLSAFAPIEPSHPTYRSSFPRAAQWRLSDLRLARDSQ